MADTFVPGLITVPMPRSAPLVKDALWPALKLCEAMLAEGLVADVLPLLVRFHPISKSAWALQGRRPGPKDHYDSIGIDRPNVMLGVHTKLILVDDVVTRGATIMGCYARMHDYFPAVPIACFGITRTISTGENSSVVLPSTGIITATSNDHIHRQP
ncbi:MAG TPA: phosphoribosyltransferase [Tepidisphaeraceae bacterium]|jgi:hypothetical protein|nr:phosphoribosyltransferase [Tepidisphaeraceae bacterium]